MIRERLDKLEGHRTYLLSVAIIIIVTIVVLAIIVRVFFFSEEMFIDALPSIGNLILNYGLLCGSIIFGYAASKGGDALKTFAGWSQMKQFNVNGRDNRYEYEDRYDDAGFRTPQGDAHRLGEDTLDEYEES